jgi:T-complex protein 1 subunit epsilon
LDEIKQDVNISKNNYAKLKECAKTALGSKVVSSC